MAFARTGREGGPRPERAPGILDGRTLARGLGWLSLALGAKELLAPRRVALAVGVVPRPTLTRLLGLREIASGVAILASRDPTIPLWSRVAGDAMDLALLGLAGRTRSTDGRRLSFALAAVAGVSALDALGAVAATARRGRSGTIRAVQSMAVNATPRECYAFWRRLENLPRFSRDLESVEEASRTHSHWVQRTLGRRLEWDAEIVRDEPGRLISWRSLGGGDVETDGVVELQERPKGGTIVRVALQVVPPAGAVGALVARLAGRDPGAMLKEDLRRFKQLLETGEIPTAEGQPSGKRDVVHASLARLLTGGVS